MYTAPTALPRSPIAWPGHVLGLLSVSFLIWSVFVPWTVGHGFVFARIPPLRGMYLPIGQFLIVAVGACILGRIAIHILSGRPSLRRFVVVVLLLLLATSVLLGIYWNTTHGGHAISGLIWGGILGMAALALAGWSPVLVTPHDHPSGDARRWSRQWPTLAALLLASLLILSISTRVVRDLRRPVVIPPKPCACLPNP